MALTFNDLLAGTSFAPARNADGSINQGYYDSYLGLRGQSLFDSSSPEWQQLAAAAQQASGSHFGFSGDYDPNQAARDTASGLISQLNSGGSNGTVRLGDRTFLVYPNANGGVRLQQADDLGSGGQRMVIDVGADGKVSDVNTWASDNNIDWKMLGPVLGAAGAGVMLSGAAGAGAAGAGGTTAGTAAGAAGAGAAGAGEAAAGSALVGGGGAGTAAGSGGLVAGSGGLGSGSAFMAGSPLMAEGAVGSGLAGTAAGAGTAAAGTGLLGTIGSKVADWATSPSGIGTILGGIGGALAGTEDQTLTQNQTSTTSLNDPTAVNQALANYGQLASGAGGYSAAVNPYADASNPYLSAAIDAANADTIRNYNLLAPATYSAGSSFGNSGLGFLEVNDRANLLSQLANTSATMNYQGYNQAATLADAYAGRQDAASQFNTNTQLAANQGLIGGAQALGGTTNSTSTSTAPGNIWASSLGGALIGSQLGNSSLFGTKKATQ